MAEAALFVLGLLLGAALFASRRRGVGDRQAPAVQQGSTQRAHGVTPVAALLGDDPREIASGSDDGFALLVSERLEDARAQHEAVAAAVWRGRSGRLELDVVAGDRRRVEAFEGELMPMLEWSEREGLAHLGPDGDAPFAAVAPLGGRDARPSGAFVLIFAEPFRGDRAALKRWVTRHGARVGVISELVRTHGELAKTNKRTRTLLRETQNWDIEERPADLGVRLCAMVEQLTGADGAALVRWDEDAHRGTVVVADGSCSQYAGSNVDDDSLAGTACREDVPQIWHEVNGRGEGPEALFSRSLPTLRGCVLVQPLKRRGKVIGAVVAAHASPGALGPAELRALSLFDAVASFRLASAWKLEEVERRALVDGLTGLANREGFEVAMRQALGEQIRFGWEISLVVVDVDLFKQVNDTHGHEVGDDVLRAIARTLEEGLRTTDVCARVGGEEMALILKDTGVEGAAELSERLRASVEALRVPFGGEEISVTASFGVATYPTRVSEWSALYRRADRALYEAKAGGRNQVRFDGAEPALDRPLSAPVAPKP